MKLVVVGSKKCMPCHVMKKQILFKSEFLEELGVKFEYIDLDEVEDRDGFIKEHNLMSTPTTWIENSEEKVRLFNGYVDIETLMEILEDEVNDNEI